MRSMSYYYSSVLRLYLVVPSGGKINGLPHFIAYFVPYLNFRNKPTDTIEMVM